MLRVDGLTHSVVLDELIQIAVRRGHPSVEWLLRTTKSCGNSTTYEILMWLGIPAIIGEHICVCRQCNRTMGG